LDIDSTIRTLEIVDAVRDPPHGVPRLILFPNQVDRRTLEGQQLVEELVAFG
jgi:chromosome partitioning protein